MTKKPCKPLLWPLICTWYDEKMFSPMTRVLFQVSYNGLPFYGWQTQIEGQVSVQSTIEQALSRRLDQKIVVVGGSRTDRGVHARGQLVTADIPDRSLTLEGLQAELNKLLRPHIFIHWMRVVHPEFRLHHHIRSKVYHYCCYSNPQYTPFLQGYALWVPDSILSSPLWERYLDIFQGTHDFRVFANTGSTVKNTIRTLYDASVRPWRHLTIFRFHGNGFLKQMIRNIMGTLLSAAQKQHDPSLVARYFELSERPPAIITAPPDGLILFRTCL